MGTAELIAAAHNFRKISVIAGVGGWFFAGLALTPNRCEWFPELRHPYSFLKVYWEKVSHTLGIKTAFRIHVQ